MANNITPAYDFKIESKTFAEKAFGEDKNSFLKTASAATSLFVLDKIREDGFARRTIETMPVSSADLIEVTWTDQPVMMGYHDVDTLAMTVPIRGRGQYRYYETAKFEIMFEKIVSETIKKNKMEMLTTKINYMDIFKKRIAERMYQIEDMTVIAGANKILADEWKNANDNNTTTSTDTYTASKQNVQFKAGVTLDKDALVKFFQMPTQNRSEIKKVLLTETLLQEVIKMSMLEVGDANVSKLWNEGVNNLKSFWGKEIVTTIKNEIVEDNKMYGFAGGSLYGWLFILRDHTVYMETKKDTLSIDSDAYIAHAVGNTKGVYLAEFAES